MHTSYTFVLLGGFTLAALGAPLEPEPAHTLQDRQVAGMLADQAVGRKETCPLNFIMSDSLKEATKHVQVTGTIDCGDGECAVSQVEEHTFGIEASASINLANVAEIGGGVTEEWTTGNQYQCNGDDGDNAVCVWVRSKYRQYKVGVPDDAEKCHNKGKSELAWIPVQEDDGNEFYCVRDKAACKKVGAERWEGK